MYKKWFNPPANWQDFEDLCQRLWRSILGDPNTHQHGRQGQPQHGVDVFGTNVYDGKITGIQCKGKNGQYGSKLTLGEIKKESKNAESFEPKLSSFIMATTSPRDARLQQRCLTMTKNKERRFPVDVWSWDDISDELNYRPDLYETLNSKELDDVLTNTIHLGRYDWYNRLSAFMSRNKIENDTSPSTRVLLRKFFSEIIDNSFNHGRATNVEVSYSNSVFRIVDDGSQYDINELLSTSGKGGHCTIIELKDVFGENVEIQYNYTDNKNVNEVVFKNNVQMSDIDPLIIEIPSCGDDFFSRSSGQTLADNYVHRYSECKKRIKIVVKQEVQMSGVIGFFDCILPALAASIDKVVFYNRRTCNMFSDTLDRYNVSYEIL